MGKNQKISIKDLSNNTSIKEAVQKIEAHYKSITKLLTVIRVKMFCKIYTQKRLVLIKQCCVQDSTQKHNNHLSNATVTNLKFLTILDTYQKENFSTILDTFEGSTYEYIQGQKINT